MLDPQIKKMVEFLDELSVFTSLIWVPAFWTTQYIHFVIDFDLFDSFATQYIQMW